MYLPSFLYHIEIVGYVAFIVVGLAFLGLFNYVGRLRIYEPMTMMDLGFFQSAAVLVFFRNSPFFYDGILILGTYFFLRIAMLFIRMDVLSGIEIFSPPKGFIIFTAILYVGFSSFLYFKYAGSALKETGEFKVVYSLNSEFVSTSFEALRYICILNTPYILKYFNKNKYLLVSLILGVSMSMGIFFGSKGAIVYIFFVLIIYLKINNIGLKVWHAMGGVAVLFFGFYLSFGGGENDFSLNFLTRLSKNADGTFLTIRDGFYKRSYIFENSFWIETFYVFFKRLGLGIESDRIGSTITRFAEVIRYGFTPDTPDGGTNVSIVLLYLLNFSKINLAIFTTLAIFIQTFIHKTIHQLFSTNYLWYLVAGWLYLRAYGILQAPSTFMLYFFKFLAGLFGYYFIYAVLMKKELRIRKIYYSLTLPFISRMKLKMSFWGIAEKRS